jgi:hypothetical protein
MVIVMTDAASLLSASVLRNLADKLYEKRKNAALEVRFSLCQSVMFSISRFSLVEMEKTNKC